MRAALLLVAAVSTVSWADVPPPRPPVRPVAACVADSDCAVSTFAGCCGSCCQPAPAARSRAQLEQERRRCAAVDCALPACTSKLACKPVRPASDFLAVCRAGACELVEARPAPNPDACRTAADCVITTWSCCGSCCAPEPRAEARARLALEQAGCGPAPCPMVPCRPETVCSPPSPPSAFVPACVAGQCRREPVDATPAFECRADADCALSYPPAPTDAPCRSSPCGCCPGTEPSAVPAALGQPVPLQRRPPPPDAREPSARPPPFGLSEGSTPRGAPPVACSPCPSPVPARAACRGGRCVVVPRIQRIERIPRLGR